MALGIKIKPQPLFKKLTWSLPIPLALTLLVLTAVMTSSIAGQKTGEIIFEDKQWDPQILRTLIEGPGYLDPALEFNLIPPPANDSEETKKELSLLSEYQRTARSKATISNIIKEAKDGDFVENFLDDKIIPKPLAKASYHLLKLADDEARYFIVKYKKRFHRPRPSQLNKDLTLVVPNPGHAAYPSGHATQSMLLAHLLTMLDPANRQSYEGYAKDIARRREIAGVHYPSDSRAGQNLAAGLLRELKKIKAFQEELAVAMKSYKKARKN